MVTKDTVIIRMNKRPLSDGSLVHDVSVVSTADWEGIRFDAVSAGDAEAFAFGLRDLIANHTLDTASVSDE